MFSLNILKYIKNSLKNALLSTLGSMKIGLALFPHLVRLPSLKTKQIKYSWVDFIKEIESNSFRRGHIDKELKVICW